MGAKEFSEEMLLDPSQTRMDGYENNENIYTNIHAGVLNSSN